MKEFGNRKVFLSYSWKDMEVAMRLYDDLTRSHLKVWRDQVDGDPTADFLEEFLAKIDECDDFIILDSKNYRMKSNWCLTEIERCFENRAIRNGPRIIVCLLDKDGEWRIDYRNEKHEELFSKVNMFKYHRLFYDGKYDNEDVYQQSIAEICALFSERYIPWNNIPSDRDLIEELSFDHIPISDIDRATILNGYNNIVRFITLQRDVSKHFEIWISDCEFFNLHLFFPRWTYCIWLGHNMHHGKFDTKCYEEFSHLAKDFPNDPRSFRGLGCISSRIGKYETAISAFCTALEVMACEENSWHKKHSEYEVLSNLAQVYINIEQFTNAVECLFKALELMKSQDFFELGPILNLVYCLISTKKYVDCKTILKKLIKEHPLESELYFELGNIYSVENDNVHALTNFEQAYSIAPSVHNAFYLLCRKSAVSDIREEAESILKQDSDSSEDNYWKGAICYYLLYDNNRALYYFDKSGGLYEWYQ